MRKPILIAFALFAFLVAGCGGTGTPTGPQGASKSQPAFAPPRQGQIKPTKTIWLQGRSFSEDSGGDAYDAGLADEYLLQTKSGLVADCTVYYSGIQCAFLPAAKVAKGVTIGQPYHGVKFAPPRQGQLAPVATFWLQTRTYTEDSGTNTYDGGAVQEYLIPQASGLRADCLEFDQISDSGESACAYVDESGVVVSTSTSPSYINGD
jgi:hypothetical protein